MEGTKVRESRKGGNRRRGARKDEKLRRMKNVKSEEIAPWPQLAVAGIENAIVEQETLDLENFDSGKPRMFCFSPLFFLSASIRERVFYSRETSVNARHFGRKGRGGWRSLIIKKRSFSDNPDAFCGKFKSTRYPEIIKSANLREGGAVKNRRREKDPLVSKSMCYTFAPFPHFRSS